MSTPKATHTTISITQSFVNTAWPWVRGRRGLMVLAAGIVVGGLALNWGWLVAAGIAPFVLAVLPCLAMCALGMCMNKAGGKSCSPGAEGPGEKPDARGGPEGGT